MFGLKSKRVDSLWDASEVNFKENVFRIDWGRFESKLIKPDEFRNDYFKEIFNCITCVNLYYFTNDKLIGKTIWNWNDFFNP